jgi:hypothetical protein
MVNVQTECPLCKREKLTPWVYEDSFCWGAYCVKHPKKLIFVLKRHVRTPTSEEVFKLYETAAKFKPMGAWLRSDLNPWATIPNHFHLHQA